MHILRRSLPTPQHLGSSVSFIHAVPPPKRTLTQRIHRVWRRLTEWWHKRG